MNVFVRKIARYQPEHNGLDRYDGYEEITTKRYDPPIEVSDYHSSPKGVTAIFSSNALRARQTAELYEGERDLPRIYTPLFAEVSFSIKKITK
ncbi:MAG: hypothetical protein UZ21_OP11001000223 [Microgenomates bacterium OLB22]|nr:MAG: hypothetical protein UZ21_OP11001000223 [Microgenomates bacterium OLB22]